MHSSEKVRSLWENEMILSCSTENHDAASLIEEIYMKILEHDLLMNPISSYSFKRDYLKGLLLFI